MKNYNKLFLALVLCVINNSYSKDVMRGAPIPTLKVLNLVSLVVGTTDL